MDLAREKLRINPGTFSGAVLAAVSLALPTILLSLAGSHEQGGAYYSDAEIVFALAAAGAMGGLAGLVAGACLRLDAPFLALLSPGRLLPQDPDLEPGDGLEVRERALPAVVPSLILPLLFAGLGGWVDSGPLIPRPARTTTI